MVEAGQTEPTDKADARRDSPAASLGTPQPGRTGRRFALMRRFINLWPPLLFSGIRVRYVDEDWRRVEAEVRLSFWNRNGGGVIFGGTLFAMADPFYPLMLQRQLGPDYAIWTKSAEIDFVSPGKDLARAVFAISENDVAAIADATADGDKLLQSFPIEIFDAHGATIARVTLVVYVRKKRQKA